MKKVLVALLSLTIVYTTASKVSAQSAVSGVTNASEISERITEMLDSMTNIRTLMKSPRAVAAQQNVKPRFQPGEIPFYSDDVVRQKLAKIQSPIPMTFNNPVKDYINLYSVRRRELSSMVLGLSKLYFPIFEQVLDRYDMPLELKYLAIVESALNPNAVSRVGATGMWQFMYTTGKMYNLEVNSYVDDRRDVYKSTVAACEYFKDMYALYKDWLLVIASYNCGPRNVAKAIARSGGKTNFWEIYRYLPRETQGYVPAFIAVNYVMRYAADLNINPSTPVITFHETDTIAVAGPLMLDKVAQTLGVQYELVKFLNPAYKKSYIPAPDDNSFHKMVLPSGKIPSFIASSQSLYTASQENAYNSIIAFAADDEKPEKTSTRTKTITKTYKVRRGDNLGNIADKYNVSIAELKKWNKIRGAKIVPGQRIKIKTTKKVRNRYADNDNDDDYPKMDESPATVETAQAAPKSEAPAAVVVNEWTKKTEVTYVPVSENTAMRSQQLNVQLAAYKSSSIGTVQMEAAPVNVQARVASTPAPVYAAKVENKKAVADKTTTKAAKETVKEQTEIEYIYHTVNSGDTLWDIAQRYNGVTVDQLKSLNNIFSSKDLKPGSRIKVAVAKQI